MYADITFAPALKTNSFSVYVYLCVAMRVGGCMWGSEVSTGELPHVIAIGYFSAGFIYFYFMWMSILPACV